LPGRVLRHQSPGRFLAESVAHNDAVLRISVSVRVGDSKPSD
jgi:hypothetical protein